ncbi:MAG: hypothetical protein JW914_02365 [Syntrophaceae bacterium]|nr:hypothetical protein [Syntrophaceae bacterium]
MFKVFSWIALISLLTSYLSFMSMADYLFKRGIIKQRLMIIGIDIIKPYYKITKAEKGKAGMWFWLYILSVPTLVVSALIEAFIKIFIGN